MEGLRVSHTVYPDVQMTYNEWSMYVDRLNCQRIGVAARTIVQQSGMIVAGMPERTTTGQEVSGCISSGEGKNQKLTEY